MFQIYSTTTPSPNSTYMVCGNLLTGAYDENVEVTCSLNNIDIDLSNLTQSPVTITAENSLGLIFDSSLDTLTSNSFTTTTANEIVLDTSTITLKFVPLQCQHKGTYTFKYSNLEGSSEVELVANVSKPVISKQPSKFYLNQEVKITCGGDVGRPKGNLVLKVKGSGVNDWTEVAEVTKSENETARCTTFMSLTYVFYVNDNMEGQQYKCEATGFNDDVLESGTETIAVSNAVVYFTKESETVQIGNSLQIGCILKGGSADLGAIVTRRSMLLGDEHLCDVSSTGDATCNLGGIDGTASVIGNNLTAIITVDSAGCEDEGTYYCESVADRSLKALLTVSVTKPPEGGPSLSIPVRMVLDFKESFGKISCTADVGYPAGDLQIQYSTDNFTTYGVFDIGIEEEIQEVISNCSIRVTKSYKEYTYTESWNNTDLRCAVFNHTDKSEPMQVSDTQTVTLIENPCASSGLTYEYHPVNCHYYISCNGGSPTVVDNCGETNCPNIQNSTVTPHCDGNCTTLC